MEDLKNKIITKYNCVNFSEFDFDKVIADIVSSGNDDVYGALENNAKLYIRTLLKSGNYDAISNIVNTLNISKAGTSECMSKISELDAFLSDIDFDGDEFSYVGMLESCNNLKFIVDKIKESSFLTKFRNRTFGKLLAGSDIIDSEKRIIEEAYSDFSFNLDDAGVKLIYSGKNSKRPPTTREEEIQYFEKIRSGDEDSRLEFLERNYRLILYFASRVSNYTSLSLMDLFQEGYFGLVEAIDKFEPLRGFKFSTYASYWISSKIGRAISKYNQIKLPVNVKNMVDKFRKQEDILKKALNRKPSIDEVAASMGLDVEKVYAIYNAFCDVRSVNELVTNDTFNDSIEVIDMIADPDNSMIERLDSDSNKAYIEDIISGLLTKKQAEVIRLRFGFYDGVEPMTFQSIGDILGSSRQDIEMTFKKALIKLATGTAATSLAECYEYPEKAKKLVKEFKNSPDTFLEFKKEQKNNKA